MTDLYKILGVKRTAARKDIHKAYRKKAKAAHPDGGWLLRGRVTQADTDFKFPVGIFLHEGKGKNATEQHFYQWITKADETFEVGPLPKRFERVSFNDDYGLLCIWEETDWQQVAGQ